MDIPGPSDIAQPVPSSSHQQQQPAGPSSPTKVGQGYGGGGTPFRSPKPRVTYSDRFIPSRAVSARLDYSILDREAAASEMPRR